jgi:hypothetical protein|tara:strand:- start:1120 stop:1527 length:408 start_codon:yes stop_codon:yes gene_type:complete
MAHFAKLGMGNRVEKVIVVSNDVATTEQAGIDFINKLLGTNDIWKQTSYNTRGGVHYKEDNMTPSEDQSKAFRKNFAGIDYKYNEKLDAFIEPQPYPSWSLNKETCLWEAPTPYPEDGETYKWEESTKNWVLINQ